MIEAPPLAPAIAAHSGLPPRLLQFTAMALGASLHLASTINLAGTSLRVGLADLLLPLILLLIVFDRLHHKQPWPAPRLAHCWWWLAALSGWMIVAILTGRFYAGSWQIWGLANKGVGWFVLVGYFIAGWWLSGHGPAPRLSFLRAFFIMGWIASAFSFVLFVLAFYQVPFILAVNYDRATGFLANPNAFGIAIAAQLALQLPLMQHRLVFPNWLHVIGIAFALLALLYSGSRSAWLGFAVALTVLLIIRRLPWRGLLFALGLAIGINGISIDLPRLLPHALALFPTTAASLAVAEDNQFRTLKPYRYVARPNMMADAASQHRILSAKLAIEYWRDHPVRGIGLGSFLWRRGQTDDPTAGTGIHATGLWLITETGLIGLVLFSAFFLATIKALVWRDGRLEADPIPIGVATVLVTLAAASMGTEILYQRYLWVLGGIGLAVAFGPLASLRSPATRSP
ncbi:MAG: O-antigen ligase family protein [Alphaproteobacteria bacterium]